MKFPPPPYGGKVHEAGARVQKTESEVRNNYIVIWLSKKHSLGPAQVLSTCSSKRNIPTGSRKHTGTSPTFFVPPGPKKKSGQVQKTCTGPKKGCPCPKNMHPMSHYSILQVPGTQMTPPFGWLTLSFMGQNLENNGHGHLASRHIIIIIKYYKYVQKILRDSIWLHDPSKVAVLFETGAQSTHFQNRFPEAMNDRGDDSKMFRNLAVQLCNSRTRAVSIIEALSTLAVRAVRAVPKSAGYREI